MKEKDFYQVSLKIILKNNQGQILGLKAVTTGNFAGYYDLPGGRIDTDEFKKNFIEIIKREIAEEVGDIQYKLVQKPVALGRHLIQASLAHEKKEIHILYVFFEAQYLGGELKISDEHTGYQWLDLKTINPKKYFKSGILEGIKMYFSME